MEPTPVKRAPRGGATAWVAVVALLAGAAGGFAGGRLSASNHDGVATGTKVDAVGGAPSDATGATASESATASTMTVRGATGSSGSFSASGAPVDYKPPTVTRLFKRVVSGVEIRISRIDQNMTNGCVGNGCPPPECFPTASVQVATIDTWDVGSGGGSLWPKIDKPAVLSGTLYPNPTLVDAKDAVTGYVLQTDASVATVRWLASDGSTRDEMTPDHNVVVLAARLPIDLSKGPIPVAPDGSTIVALDAAGKVLTRITPSGMDESAAMGGMSQKCLDAMKGPNTSSGDEATTTATPIQPMPAKGEQPTDLAAADQAVRATFTAAMGGNGAPANDANIDDPDGLQALRDASAKQFPQYAEPGKVKFVLDELVFTSPTRASFRYRVLTTDNETLVISHIGTTRAVNGKWLITRATMCELLPVHPNGTC